MEPVKKMLAYREAAEYLGVHFRTLQGWVRRKTIPHIRYSPHVVKFPLEDLQLWVEAKAVSPAEIESPTERRQRKAKNHRYEQAMKHATEILKKHYGENYPRQIKQ
jgi:excisionase family DNA binding protein